jgi:hypothetical protein
VTGKIKDIRVKKLWDRVQRAFSGRVSGPQIQSIFDEIVVLHAGVADIEARVSLISLQIQLSNLLAKNLADVMPDRVVPMLHVQLKQYHLMLREESLTADTLDMQKLRCVTDRETLAGRLNEDDPLRRFALGREYIFRNERDGLFDANERKPLRTKH